MSSNEIKPFYGFTKALSYFQSSSLLSSPSAHETLRKNWLAEFKKPSDPAVARRMQKLTPQQKKEFQKFVEALEKEQKLGGISGPLTQKLINTKPNLAGFIAAFPVIGVLVLLLLNCAQRKKPQNKNFLYFLIDNKPNSVESSKKTNTSVPACFPNFEKLIKPEGARIQAEYEKIIRSVGSGQWAQMSLDKKADLICNYFFSNYPYITERGQNWIDADEILEKVGTKDSVMDCDKYAVLVATSLYIMLQKAGFSKADIEKKVSILVLNNQDPQKSGHAIALYQSLEGATFTLEGYGHQDYKEFSNYLDANNDQYLFKFQFNTTGSVCENPPATLMPLPIYKESSVFPSYRILSSGPAKRETKFKTPTLNPSKTYTLNSAITHDYNLKIQSLDGRNTIPVTVNNANQYQFSISQAQEYMLVFEAKNVQSGLSNSIALFENNAANNTPPINPTPTTINEYSIAIADTFSSGTLSTANPGNNYSCDLIAGKTYEIFWNDADAPSAGQTQDIKVGLFFNGTAVVSPQDKGYNTPITYTPNVSGTYKLNVLPYANGNLTTNPKTYQLKIREKIVAPATNEFFNLLLSQNWTEGTMNTGAASQTYKINLLANTNYELEWDDSYFGSGNTSLDVKVSFKNADGSICSTTIGQISDQDTSFGNPLKFKVPVNGEYWIEVQPYFPGRIGTYRLRMYPSVNP